jgi:isopenicillin-N N-acyltransferase-like protein
MSIEIINLAGDAFTRGISFGSARQREIHAFIRDWLESLRAVGIASPETYIAEMLRDTDFLTAIRQFTPALLEEVRGIAVGAKQPMELLLASQFMDEEWAYRPRILAFAETPLKCSSAAIVSRGGPTWIGQNMDLGGYTDGHQVLMRIAPQGAEPAALVFTIGGMIGLMGVNGRGVGVCVNALPQLPHSERGLPVAFMIRRLLQESSASAAARVVSTLPHASGQNYVIADTRSARSFEASAVGTVEYQSPDPSKVLHTNHPLAAVAVDLAARTENVDSVARLRALTDRLMNGDPDLDAIKEALCSSDDRDHPVCKLRSAGQRVSSATGMASFTTGSMISALDAASPMVDAWVTAGPPSLRGYARVRLPKGVKGFRSMTSQTDRIEKKIILPCPLERVWSAISEARQFGTWMGLSDHGEFVKGTVFTAKMAPTKFNAEFAELQEPYDRLPVKMTIDRIEPPFVFSFHFHPFAIDPNADYSKEPMNQVVFELKEVPAGTTVTMTEMGFDRIPLERRAVAYDVNNRAWGLALKALESYLATRS